MRGADRFWSKFILAMCLGAAACGAQSKAAKEPAQAAPAAPAAAPESATDDSLEPPSTEQGDVGMKFEDKGDDSERAERTPPPTRTWKPLDKDKQAKSTRQPANK